MCQIPCGICWKPSPVQSTTGVVSLDEAVQEDDGPGVIVVLETWENESLSDRLANYFEAAKAPGCRPESFPILELERARRYSRISVSVKCDYYPPEVPAISGFDLEVVEYVKWKEQESE